MKFAEIAQFFERMESTTKRLELTEILVELLKNTPTDEISKVTYLIQGKIRPNFEGVELGIAEKLAIRSISKSAGIPIKKVEEDYRLGGDLGLTAANVLKEKHKLHFLLKILP